MTLPAVGASTAPSPLDAAAGGGDGAAIGLADYDGAKDRLTIPGAPSDLLGVGRGLAGLEMIDEVALLMAPDEVRLANLGTNVLNQCIRLKDRFAILSVAEGQGDAAIPALIPPLDTSYGAIYYPWIRVQDPTTGPLLVPPTGHVAGIYARTDIERGVHKAPANEVVQGILTRDVGGNGPLEFPISKGTQDILNPRGINCIRDFRRRPRSSASGVRGRWRATPNGSTSTSGGSSSTSRSRSTRGRSGWCSNRTRRRLGQVRAQHRELPRRASGGAAPPGSDHRGGVLRECDRTTMTQDDIDNGRLICYIGVAPVKPAEFVIFRIRPEDRSTRRA